MTTAVAGLPPDDAHTERLHKHFGRVVDIADTICKHAQPTENELGHRERPCRDCVKAVAAASKHWAGFLKLEGFAAVAVVLDPDLAG